MVMASRELTSTAEPREVWASGCGRVVVGEWLWEWLWDCLWGCCVYHPGGLMQYGGFQKRYQTMGLARGITKGFPSIWNHPLFHVYTSTLIPHSLPALRSCMPMKMTINEGFCGEEEGINSPLVISEALGETAAISYQDVNLTSIISSTSGNYTTLFLGQSWMSLFVCLFVLVYLC